MSLALESFIPGLPETLGNVAQGLDGGGRCYSSHFLKSDAAMQLLIKLAACVIRFRKEELNELN